MSQAIRPGLSKAGCLRALLNSIGFRKWRAGKLGLDFLFQVPNKFPWLAFLIQAPQALLSLTGYGLQLGSIMGLVSDVIYGGIRAAGGARVTIVGPPPSDPLGQAATWVAGGSPHYSVRQGMTPADHYAAMCGDIIALAILTDNYDAGLYFSRIDGVLSSQTPIRWPWNESTVVAFELVDSDWPRYVDAVPPETWADRINTLVAEYPAWYQAVAAEWAGDPVAQFVFMGLVQYSRAWFDKAAGYAGAIEPVFEPEEIAFAHSFAYHIFPRLTDYPEVLQAWIARTVDMMNDSGVDAPTPDMLKRAANEFTGGYFRA